MFRVKATGTFISPKNEILQITSTGTDEKIIAVSKKTGRIFGLYGCLDKERNFQELIKQSKVRLGSVSEALSIGLLYYRLVDDPDFQRVVYRRLEFKHAAENYFFERFDQSLAEQKFNRWLRLFSKFAGKHSWGLVADKHGNGYSVSVTFLWRMHRETPRLKQMVIFFDQSGSHQRQESTILFSV